VKKQVVGIRYREEEGEKKRGLTVVYLPPKRVLEKGLRTPGTRSLQLENWKILRQTQGRGGRWWRLGS